MRRTKTYVITIGVALLSAAPIFNYALAQQGSNSTQLLLQVQTMRQEVAELRDMVERQQFQLKRLQKQSDAQSRQLQSSQGLDSGVSNNVDRSSYGGQLPQTQGGLISQGNAVTQVNSAGLPAGIDGDVASTVYTENTGDLYRSSIPDQTLNSNTETVSIGTEQAVNNASSTANRTITQAAANQDPYSNPVSVAQPQDGSAASNYPPVIDRSFDNVSSDVPVTGAGTRLPATSIGSQDVGTSQTFTTGGQEQLNSAQSDTNLAAFTQENAAQVNSAPLSASSLPASSGVVSIPTQVASAGQVQGAIDASQIPVQGSSQVSNQGTLGAPTANTTASIEPVSAPLVSEDEYYTQGFELLKQSKYEEAASIFEQQLQTYPNGDLADDAHYWIAEAMHVSRKLDVAKVHLKTIISDYPQSRRLPDAMLKTAYIEQSQGNQIEARILFQEIVNLHPQSDAAIAAKNQLAAVN